MGSNSFIIIDTGFFVALSNSRDKHHEATKKCLKKIGKKKWITTWPILTETSHFLSQVSANQYYEFLKLISQGLCEIFPLGPEHLPQMVDLTLKYHDLPMDMADASLVILAEEIGSGDIVSTDQRDFRTYRWKNKHPFNNLLL